MISIFIATPAFGEMFYSVYVRSLFGLQHVLAARGWPCALASLSFSDLVESRSVLLTALVRPDQCEPSPLHRRRHGIRSAADR